MDIKQVYHTWIALEKLNTNIHALGKAKAQQAVVTENIARLEAIIAEDFRNLNPDVDKNTDEYTSYIQNHVTYTP